MGGFLAYLRLRALPALQGFVNQKAHSLCSCNPVKRKSGIFDPRFNSGDFRGILLEVWKSNRGQFRYFSLGEFLSTSPLDLALLALYTMFSVSGSVCLWCFWPTVRPSPCQVLAYGRNSGLPGPLWAFSAQNFGTYMEKCEKTGGMKGMEGSVDRSRKWQKRVISKCSWLRPFECAKRGRQSKESVLTNVCWQR